MTVIRGATNITATVAVENQPYRVAVNPVWNRIYVAGYANVTVIDGVTNSTTTLAGGTSPMAVAVNTLTIRISRAPAGEPV